MKLFHLAFLLLVLFGSCSVLPESPKVTVQKIATGFGPEDIETDTLQSASRLLISCAARREQALFYGEIEQLNTHTGQLSKLVRVNEPKDFKLSPHGIYLYTNTLNQQQLFVIHHNDSENIQAIVAYQLNADTLRFLTWYQNDLMNSPNDLVVVNDSTFMVANDSGTRGSMMEKVLGLKKGSVVQFQSGKWTKLADNLGMPAGIGFKNNTVYVSCATESIIYAFNYKNNKFVNKRIFAEVESPDNISMYANSFLTASHFSSYQFIRHISKSENLSSGVVYSFDLATGKRTVLFSNSGEQISANSVAVHAKNDVYIGQVFENWILKISQTTFEK